MSFFFHSKHIFPPCHRMHYKKIAEHWVNPSMVRKHLNHDTRLLMAPFKGLQISSFPLFLCLLYSSPTLLHFFSFSFYTCSSMSQGPPIFHWQCEWSMLQYWCTSTIVLTYGHTYTYSVVSPGAWWRALVQFADLVLMERAAFCRQTTPQLDSERVLHTFPLPCSWFFLSQDKQHKERLYSQFSRATWDSPNFWTRPLSCSLCHHKSYHALGTTLG